MNRTVVLATHNLHKVAELARILEGLDVTLRSAHDLALPDVDETGDTFAANALLKARAAAEATGLPAIADDSGLVVDALDGAPGIYSARYAGPQRDDEDNLALVLARMRGVAQRQARFVCAAALAGPDCAQVREGVLEGELTTEPRGTGGFGYDPILVPLGHQRTCAELTPAEKDAISHRGAAFRALREDLVACLG